MTDALSPNVLRVFVPGLGPRDVSAVNPLPVHLRSLLKQDDRQKFWAGRTNWPEDAFGKVFLARAAIQVGKALFSDDWTGHEPGVDYDLAPLPMFPSQALNWEVRAALDAVPFAERVLSQSTPLERVASLPKARSTVDQRDWDRAVEIRNLTLAEIDAPGKDGARRNSGFVRR